MTECILVTGGAGFIGSAVIRYILRNTDASVVNLDSLTYAGSLSSLSEISGNPRYKFEEVDIRDRGALSLVFKEHKPSSVMHLAAESHVDRSIDAPAEFITTNILGTYNLLEVAREYWLQHRGGEAQHFRFHHVSTDEVYGDLGDEQTPKFSESSPYRPSSPYSASKASADHLVRSWGRTFDLPVVVSNCSNNYGPYQFPEKMIPHMILRALAGRKMPVYGDGGQIRDWLHVEDHARMLYGVLKKGEIGETYNISGNCEMKNIEIVDLICDCLEEMAPEKPTDVERYRDLITFVDDRPGHDRRYSVNAGKIERELGLGPEETFSSGLRRTVQWYLSNKWWWSPLVENRDKLDRQGRI